MSRARKHVTARALGDCPELGPSERIVKVVASRGSNQIEVEDPSAKNTLCLLPAKFQKMLWVRRGSFVIVDETDRSRAEESGGKVTGTITCILFPDHVRELKKQGMWPAAFELPGIGSASEAAEPSTSERGIEALRLQERTQDGPGSQVDGGVLRETEESSDESGDEGQAPLERNPNHGNRPGDEWESSSEEESDEELSRNHSLSPSRTLRT